MDTCVDSELEITEIADRVSKKNGRALLFNKVKKNSPYPVLINAVGSYERLHMAFEVEDLDDIAHEISELVNMGNYLDIMSQIKSIPRLTRMLHVFPKKVKKRAICQEVIEEPDLDSLPILKCWPEDGGRYMTLPLVITKDPETGQQNMGMYRLQVYDKKNHRYALAFA